MKNTSVVTTFICLSAYLLPEATFAQKIGNEMEAGKWHVKNVLTLNDSLGIAQIEYTHTSQGVAFINNMAKPIWDVPLKKNVLGFGKWKDKVVAFYADEWIKIDEIRVAVIDYKAKKVITDRAIYNRSGKDRIIPIVQNDINGNFKCLLIRSIAKNDENTTTSLSMVELSDNLEPVTKNINSVVVNETYLNSYATPQGDLFISGIVDKKLITEQFNSSAQIKSKLEAPIDIRNKSKYNVVMRVDTPATNVLLAIQYTNENKDATISCFRFDFGSQKVFSAQEKVLDKSYHKQLKESDADGKTSSLKNIDDLKPVDILMTSGKIVLTSEIQYEWTYKSSSMNMMETRYYNNAAIVVVYNLQMQEQNEVVLNKSSVSFLPYARDLKIYHKINKLYILSSELKGLASYNDFCYIIDLNTGKKEKKLIGPDDPSPKKKMDASCSFLFGDGCVITRLVFEGLLIPKWTTSLQKIKYEELNKLTSVEM